MADWNQPTVATAYATVLSNLKDRDIDAGTLFLNLPSNPVTGMIRYNRTDDVFEEYNGASWIPLVLDIAGGGTGASTAPGARSALGLGTLALQNSNAVTITGGTISGLTSLGSSGDITAPNLIGEVQLGNNQYIKGKTSGGTSRGILSLDNNNIVKVGHASHEMQFNSAITSIVTVGKAGATGQIVTQGNNAIIDLRELDASADEKYWRFVVEGETFKIQKINDAFTIFSDIMTYTTSAGWTIPDFAATILANPTRINSSLGNAAVLQHYEDVTGRVKLKFKSGADAIQITTGSDVLLIELGSIIKAANAAAGSIYASYGFNGLATAGMGYKSSNDTFMVGHHVATDTQGFFIRFDNGTRLMDFQIHDGAGSTNSPFTLGYDYALMNGNLRTNAVYPEVDNTYKLGKNGNRYTEVWSVNGTIQTSDAKQKSIVGASPGLDLIGNLIPVKYYWKHTPGKLRMGFVAQQVQRFASQYDLLRDEEPENLGLNYTELIAPIVQSIQELYALVQTKAERT